MPQEGDTIFWLWVTIESSSVQDVDGSPLNAIVIFMTFNLTIEVYLRLNGSMNRFSLEYVSTLTIQGLFMLSDPVFFRT